MEYRKYATALVPNGRMITVLATTYGKIESNRLGLIAAGVAFFSMLSVFPAIAALIALLSLVADPELVVVQLEGLRELMPEDVYEILNTQVVALVSTGSETLGWASAVSILLALWSARAGVGAMMHGLNAVYGQRNRGSLSHYLRAYILTAILVTVAIIALLTLVVAPVALAFVPFGALSFFLLDALRWIVAVGVIYFGIALLYRFGVNRSVQKARWWTPGALLAITSWAILSFAFSYYVANFGTYNEVYGSIGAVIAMLVWLWISSFLVLLGAALNAALEGWEPTHK